MRNPTAGWDVEKTRLLERRCVEIMAMHFKAVERTPSMDLSNPDQPLHYGKPFTFQHIAWSNLTRILETAIQVLDPDKLAAVKASVLDCYETNSKTGEKLLPSCEPDKRKSDDLSVSEAEIEHAQEEIDNHERFREASRMLSHEDYYVEPGELKKKIKRFLTESKMSEAEFRQAIDVTESEYALFRKERKRTAMLESKAYHNAHSFFKERETEEENGMRKWKRTGKAVTKKNGYQGGKKQRPRPR